MHFPVDFEDCAVEVGDKVVYTWHNMGVGHELNFGVITGIKDYGDYYKIQVKGDGKSRVTEKWPQEIYSLRSDK